LLIFNKLQMKIFFAFFEAIALYTLSFYKANDFILMNNT